MSSRDPLSDPLEADLSRALGLESLETGRHTLRDSRRVRVGVIEVQSLWCARIEPSFDSQSVICVARAEETTFRGNRFPAWWRAGIAIGGEGESKASQSVVIDVKDDLLASALDQFRLSTEPESSADYLDGIGYALEMRHADFTATIHFCNPTRLDLMNIEQALFATANHIAEGSSDPLVFAYLERWRGYFNRIRPRNSEAGY